MIHFLVTSLGWLVLANFIFVALLLFIPKQPPQPYGRWHQTPRLYFWRPKWRRHFLSRDGYWNEYADDVTMARIVLEERFGEKLPQGAPTQPIGRAANYANWSKIT